MLILMQLVDRIDSARLPTLRSAGVAVERYPDYVNTGFRPHGVDVVLFTCVIGGAGVHQMDELQVPVGPGSVGVTHYGQTHDLLTGRDPVDVMNVYVDLRSHALPVVPPPWDRVLASILAPHPSVVHRQNRRVHLQFDDPRRLAAPLLWMQREQADNAPACDAVMRQLLSLFLVECCRIAHRTGESFVEPAPDWVEQVRHFIDEHFDRAIGLADMTRVAGVSPEHLCRRFRQHTGLTPVAYLNDRRLQQAMWLLRTTHQSVTRIALVSGFGDLTYFNRRFKAATGVTPTAFRKQAGTEADA